MNKTKKSFAYYKKSIIAFALSFLIPLLFFSAYIGTVPVEKEQCEEIRATYEYCEQVKGLKSPYAGLHLYFDDGASYYIEEYCLGYGLLEELEALSKGTALNISVYKEYGNIVEVSTDEKDIFTYEQYVERTERDKKSSLYIFYFSLIVPLIAFGYMIKEKNKYNHKHS